MNYRDIMSNSISEGYLSRLVIFKV